MAPVAGTTVTPTESIWEKLFPKESIETNSTQPLTEEVEKTVEEEEKEEGDEFTFDIKKERAIVAAVASSIQITVGTPKSRSEPHHQRLHQSNQGHCFCQSVLMVSQEAQHQDACRSKPRKNHQNIQLHK